MLAKEATNRLLERTSPRSMEPNSASAQSVPAEKLIGKRVSGDVRVVSILLTASTIIVVQLMFSKMWIKISIRQRTPAASDSDLVCHPLLAFFG